MLYDSTLGLSPDDKNKSLKVDDNPSPPQEYSKYANIANATPAIRLLHARDSRLSVMVSTQLTEHCAPTLSTPVSRKLFNTSTITREEAQHETTTASDDLIWRMATNAPTQSTPVSQNAPTQSTPANQNISDKLAIMREEAQRTLGESTPAAEVTLGGPAWRMAANAPTQSTPVSQNNSDKKSEQVREAAEREQEMLRVTTLLSQTIDEVEQTKSQLHTVNELQEVTHTELGKLKTAYEEMCQLKATTDYEKSAALTEKAGALREKAKADEEVQKGLRALADLQVKMDAETKLMTDKFNDLMKKDWPAPATVKKLEAAVLTQEKTIKSLKSQLELKNTSPQAKSTEDPSWAQLYVKIEAELEELKKDYKLIEATSDEALSDFSKEMMDMNKQISDMQTIITDQQQEITELQTLKPRELAKILVQSAPPGKDKDKASSHQQAPATAQAQKPAASAPAPAAGEDTSIDSDYLYQGKSEDDDSQTEYRVLKIEQVTDQLNRCKQEMDANIKDQKARLKLGSSQKMTKEQKDSASHQYDEEMLPNIELWHTCMGDWAQKYVAYGHKRPPVHKGPGKMKMNCAGCGVVQGDWHLNHARANRQGSRQCPAKDTVCKTCCMYHLHDQEGSERYTNHTPDACPLNNTVSFFKKLNSELIEKHKAPEVSASLDNSAWS